TQRRSAYRPRGVRRGAKSHPALHRADAREPQRSARRNQFPAHRRSAAKSRSAFRRSDSRAGLPNQWPIDLLQNREPRAADRFHRSDDEPPFLRELQQTPADLRREAAPVPRQLSRVRHPESDAGRRERRRATAVLPRRRRTKTGAARFPDELSAGPYDGGDRRVKRLTHVAADGRTQMVDVSAKPLRARTAVAEGRIALAKETVTLIRKNEIAKGDVIATARLAGIQAAKRTAHLIPLCHTIPLSDVKIEIKLAKNAATVNCTARTVAQTGVEMEALTGVSIALLTIYDMCKAVDKQMVIGEVRLVEKTKSAVSRRE